MSMSDYLGVKGAEYSATTLQVTPQNTMVELADKNQVVHEADDGTISVVSLSTTNIFTVTMQWDGLTEAEADTIRDFWADTSKGNGRARTFYWKHPTDGETYTVRFLEPLQKTFSTNLGNYRQIQQVKIRVEGVKP